MTGGRPLRAMWLLNHTTARAFEVPMMKRAGVDEIFLPKSFPQDYVFRSGSIDDSEDRHLTIPRSDLARLNDTDWYARVPREVWDIANRHFDLLFFTAFSQDAVESIARHFRGIALLRAYGLDTSLSYSKLLASETAGALVLRQRGSTLMFAEAYEGLRRIEAPWLAQQGVFLPLGLADAEIEDNWTGAEARIFFVCPEVRTNPYYAEVYKRFLARFGDLPYRIGGAQPVPALDPNAPGFVARAEFERTMREMRLMFYHSSEPRHVHYHPFEAVKAGMPLVYMKGGLLSRFAGRSLPGEAATPREARAKVERLLAGDRAFIDAVRESQPALVEAMSPTRAEPHWRRGIAAISARLDEARRRAAAEAARRRRVAVILPVAYRGGSLRGAKMLAEALLEGSRQAGEEASIVLACPDDPDTYGPSDFADLPEGITLRPFTWTELTRARAKEALELAGHESAPLTAASYDVPDDGINNLLDCDAWVIVSDRLNRPLLPMRPCIHLIFDVLQRYVEVMDPGPREIFADVCMRADRILVTTDFTGRDVRQFLGIPTARIGRMPMLVPTFAAPTPAREMPAAGDGYFVWTTNQAPHKNHRNAMEALALYYGEFGGRLRCRVTGVGTSRLLEGERPHLRAAGDVLAANPGLQRRLRFMGDLAEGLYRTTLSASAFLWHPGLVDNGTFSVVEAAAVGVPSLSSDYPAMREIDETFSLNLNFADPTDPRRIAEALKWMEENAAAARTRLPPRDVLESHGPERLGAAYWAEVREWL